MLAARDPVFLYLHINRWRTYFYVGFDNIISCPTSSVSDRDSTIRVDRAMIYTTLNRYEKDCLPGWDVSLWRSYRITMQITPANMYTNHSPIEYASLKVIRICLYYQSAFPKVTHFTSIGKGGHIRSILTVGDDPFSLRKMSEIHIQSLNLALHVHVYPTTHDMKMGRLLDGLISVHPILDF